MHGMTITTKNGYDNNDDHIEFNENSHDNIQ